MALPPTELTVLLDLHDPERSALRLRKEGCLADGADAGKVADVIAAAYTSALERGKGHEIGGYNPAHEAADALGKARLLSSKGVILWRKRHEPAPWWKFWA